MLQSNPNVAPDLPYVIAPDTLPRPLSEDCTYVPSLPSVIDESLDLGLINHVSLEQSLASKNEKDDDDERYTRKDIVIQVIACTALVAAAGYWGDVAQNMQDEAKAQPSLEVVAEAHDPANNHKAVIVEDGFNIVSANLITDRLSSSIQKVADGELWAVQSNNALMNTDDLFEKAVELAQERGITSISVVDYSMGAMRGVDTAEQFVKKTDIPVENIILMSSPSGYDGLPDQRKEQMQWAKTVAQWIPGAAHSTFFRYLVELYFYKDQYTKPESNQWEYITKNIPRFFNAISGINKRFEKPYTSNSFLLEQIDAINRGDPTGKIEEIGKYEQEHTKQKTVVTYIGSTAPDDMVNEAYSKQQYQQSAQKGELDFEEADVEDVPHGEYYPTWAVKAYDKVYSAIADKIKPLVEMRRRENISLHIEQQYQHQGYSAASDKSADTTSADADSNQAAH